MQSSRIVYSRMDVAHLCILIMHVHVNTAAKTKARVMDDDEAELAALQASMM